MSQSQEGTDEGNTGKPCTPFGERLRASRLSVGISVQEIADQLGCTNQAIYNYEKLPRDITAETLFKLADMLGVNARWLLAGEDDGDRPKKQRSEAQEVAVEQAIACLEAFLQTGSKSADLVRASISLLKQSGNGTQMPEGGSS